MVNINSELKNSIIIKSLGMCHYEESWQKMKSFTQQRIADTIDELWQLEHYPVFTLGQAGLTKHILEPLHIPIIHSDRGGQITYHGPGQLIIYLLINVQRKNLTIRKVIHSIQNSVIDLLASKNIDATSSMDNPGVYVHKAKICSIGLKAHKGSIYHGLSLNVNMDLDPFSSINPCGQPNLKVTQLRDLGVTDDLQTIANILTTNLLGYLSYYNYP